MIQQTVTEKISHFDFHGAREQLLHLSASSPSTLKLHEKISKHENAYNNERSRLFKMKSFETTALKNGYLNIAGVDEAGRGPLAGPVVAACVILPSDVEILGLDDSKKCSPKTRDRLFDEIYQCAISIGVGIISAQEIDELNILRATKKAMRIALYQMTTQPDFILVDAETIDNIQIKQQGIIQGDAKSVSIAAASIIAKVTRDRLMCELDTTYPQYGFSKHKGYGTKEHITAIKELGICPIHRVSFTKNFMC